MSSIKQVILFNWQNQSVYLIVKGSVVVAFLVGVNTKVFIIMPIPMYLFLYASSPDFFSLHFLVLISRSYTNYPGHLSLLMISYIYLQLFFLKYISIFTTQSCAHLEVFFSSLS